MSSPSPPEETTEPPESPPPGPEPGPVDGGRSVRVSYGLWCLWLVGFGGIHRIYNRKLLTGLLWLFTFGLCGIGQLVDLFLIPAMVGDSDGQARPKLPKARDKDPEEESEESGEEDKKEPTKKAEAQASEQQAEISKKRTQVSNEEAQPSSGESEDREARSTTSVPESPATEPPDTERSPPLDLLRERRHQLNLKPLSGLFVLRPVLIRRGLLIGGLILGGSVVICVLLVVIQQLLRAREAQLIGFEEQATRLRETIAIQQAGVKGLQTANEQFVKRLSDVRSSSALLADLQLRVPEGVQLTKVQVISPTDEQKMSPTEMRLEGQARDPVGFGRVNAMELVLRRSPLFLATGVTIEKAERVPEKLFDVTVLPSGKPAGQPIKVQLPSAVNFQMKATLSPLAADKVVAVMENLQAKGMARRLELLQREGLLK